MLTEYAVYFRSFVVWKFKKIKCARLPSVPGRSAKGLYTD